MKHVLGRGTVRGGGWVSVLVLFWRAISNSTGSGEPAEEVNQTEQMCQDRADGKAQEHPLESFDLTRTSSIFGSTHLFLLTFVA